MDGPIAEIIRRRTSVRTYVREPIDPTAQQQLAEVLAGLTAGPLGTPLRFDLIAAAEGDASALRGLGTYGMIRNPPGFIVGAVEPGGYAMEDYGHALEHAVLEATRLGLGTCWLGGTFNRSRFADKVDLGEGQTIPAVIVVGQATARRGTLDKVVRWGAGSKKRKPWDQLLFDGQFGVPCEPSASGPLEQPLEMLRLAPSASNKQPWRIVLDRTGGTVHLYVERLPRYRKMMEGLRLADLQRVDIGIAMCHLERTAREAGVEGRWVDEDPGIDAPPNTEYIISWSGHDA